MIKELDTVVLTTDVPAEKLQAGDVGTVVLVHEGGKGFEVEFTSFAGSTLSVATLPAAAVRPVTSADVKHVRTSLTPASA
jgi:hypothetical protein